MFADDRQLFLTAVLGGIVGVDDFSRQNVHSIV